MLPSGRSSTPALWLWAWGLILLPSLSVWADDAGNGKVPETRHSIVAYGGILTARTFGKTVFNVPGDLESAYIYALGVNRRLFDWPRHVTWEGEFLFAKHRQTLAGVTQRYEEYIACILLRYHHFPWDRHLNTTVAFGEGFSYTSERSLMETEKASQETRRLLNYLAVEVTLSHPQHPDWSLVYRIHHRSGIFGLMGGLKGVSDFYNLGIRYHF